MADIRHITPGDRPARGGDHVLVERAGNGKFVASSVSSRLASDVFYAPEPTEDLGSAIAAAETWADLNGVPVVYVVEGLSPGSDTVGAP